MGLNWKFNLKFNRNIFRGNDQLILKKVLELRIKWTLILFPLLVVKASVWPNLCGSLKRSSARLALISKIKTFNLNFRNWLVRLPTRAKMLQNYFDPKNAEKIISRKIKMIFQVRIKKFFFVWINKNIIRGERNFMKNSTVFIFFFYIRAMVKNFFFLFHLHSFYEKKRIFLYAFW